MISINHNPSILKTQLNLESATDSLNKALERMSTGFKVNCAADDAAGLYVATALSAQLRGINQARKNVQDGISFLSTGASSLENMKSILNRLRDLSVQASNGVYSDEARTAMQEEADELTKQIYQIKNGTNFNGRLIFGEAETLIKTVTKSLLDSQAKSLSGNDSSGFLVAISKVSESEAIADGYTVIKTAADLDNIRNNLSGKYMLMNDIDLSGYANWDPIGGGNHASAPNFEGTLDGNGFKVSNLKIDRERENDVGLIGCAEGATIKNIGMENVDVKGSSSVGGLVGANDYSSTITNSYTTGTVASTGDGTGGLVGRNFSSSTITNSYATGAVSGYKYTGGFVGENDTYCTITNSYATGAVSGNKSIGGFVGYNNNGYSVGCTITNSYATGAVSGDVEVGGFVGNNYGATITNSYATGAVTGDVEVGGFVGNHYGVWGHIVGSFWDTEKSGQTVGAGYDSQNDPTKLILTGLTSVEMTDSKNFTDAGWTTADWLFEAGKPPQLAWQNPTPPAPPLTGDLRIQVGANSDSYSAIFVDTTFKLGNLKIDLLTTEKAIQSISDIDAILDKINEKGSDFGAVLNRLDSVLQSQMTQIENTTAAISTIMDADIAEDSAIYIKNQLLQQTSASLLAMSHSIHKKTIMGLIK